MMATLKKYRWIVAAAFLLPMLTSCLDKGRHVTSFWTIGVVQHNTQDSSRWWFMNDDSITFAPANKYNPPKEIRRAYAFMESDSDIPSIEGFHNTVNITDIQPIKELPVTASSDAYISDSAPHDKLLELGGWHSLQYLNLEIIFNSYDASKHTFRLLRDSLQTDQTVQLYLSHSNGGSSEYERLGTFISFDLETLAERNTQDSVRLRFVSPVDDNDILEFTYRFNK